MVRRNVKVSLGISAAVVTAMLVAPPLLFSHFGVEPVKPQDCPEVQLVYARGTGEPPGFGGLGEAFVAAVRAEIPDKSIDAYAVDYPASFDFLLALDGAKDAQHFIEDVVASCPQTQIVLAGYSQGAAVVDLLTAPRQSTFGLGDPLPASIAEHVAAVVVFGNPVNRVSGPLTRLSPLFGYKAIDVCNGADPICAPQGPVAEHRVYVESGRVTQAAKFVARQLRPR